MSETVDNHSDSRSISLNVKKGSSVPVYNDQGIRISNCQASFCIDDLRQGTSIQYIEEGKKYIYSHFTKSREDTLMYKVAYQNPNAKDSSTNDQGWIEAKYTTVQKIVSTPTSPDDCRLLNQSGKNAAYQAIIEKFGDEELAMSQIKLINKDYKKLIDAGVGTCIATESNINKKLHNKWIGKDFIYDSVVLPEMMKKSPPAIKNERGRTITNQDLREIDVLARTIYSEVSKCFADGYQYPMFVAAVAKNRVDYYNDVFQTPEFIKGNHHRSKGVYAKVLTTSEMFSPWNKPPPPEKIKSPKDYKALRTLLCPPVSEKKDYYPDHTPSAEELEYFATAVKMATEAILYPTLFKARAHEVWHYFFTSGENHFKNMKRVYPSIHGQAIENEKCIEVWNGLPGNSFPINDVTGEPSAAYKKDVEYRRNLFANKRKK